MARSNTLLVTKELSKRTWPDFVKLFTQGNGWDHCFCVHFHRPCALPASQQLPTRAQRAVRNQREQKQLLAKGESHGILVYAGKEPVGWCQYGQKEELPRIDSSRNYRDLTHSLVPENLWRITCFVVDKRYRRRGIGTVALKAALESIRSRGGGAVEAYPVARWDGASFGNVSTHGTLSMFTTAGFEVVGTYGPRNVLVRRNL